MYNHDHTFRSKKSHRNVSDSSMNKVATDKPGANTNDKQK